MSISWTGIIIGFFIGWLWIIGWLGGAIIIKWVIGFF